MGYLHLGLYSDDVGTIRGSSLIASKRPLAGRANTKRDVRDTMDSDRPSRPMSARPVPQFTSVKIARSPLYVATGSIATSRASPSG